MTDQPPPPPGNYPPPPPPPGGYPPPPPPQGGGYPPPPPSGGGYQPSPPGGGYQPSPQAAIGYPPPAAAGPVLPKEAYTPWLTRVSAWLIDFIPLAILEGIGWGLLLGTRESACITDTSEYDLGEYCAWLIGGHRWAHTLDLFGRLPRSCGPPGVWHTRPHLHWSEPPRPLVVSSQRVKPAGRDSAVS